MLAFAASLLALVSATEAYTLFPNASISYLSNTPASECCFERLNSSFSSVQPVDHEFCYDETVLSGMLLLEFSRNDTLPFWDFDLSADQAILRRSEPYVLSKRYPFITGQHIDISNFVNMSTLYATSQHTNAFACGEFPSAAKKLSDDTFCVTSPGMTPPLVFQTRVQIATTRISIVKGTALVLVTPSQHVRMLRNFPVVHALRYQSQVNFTLNDHAQQQQQQQKQPVPVHIIELHVGQTVEIPSYYSHRLIVLEKDTQWTQYRTLNNTMQDLRTQAIAAFPRMFHLNALRDQPVFFGMWCLALWADEVFSFTEHATSRQTSKLLQLAKERWGDSAFIRGHADDEEDLGNQAVEIAQFISEECEDMKKIAKDMMLNEREAFKLELETAGKQTRELLLGKVQDEVFYELGMDLFELAISNIFGSAGIRAFMRCYFSPQQL